MTSYIPLKPRPKPQIEEGSQETQLWKSFISPVIVKENNTVTNIHFNASKPHEFAVTSSARVQIYSTRTNSVIKSISRFTDTAYSGHFRSDGKLLVAGDHTGLIQIFDSKSRVILRSFKEHRGPVKLTKFHPDSTKLLSGSDDKLVKLWDIPSQASINTFNDHTDYVRCGSINPTNPNLIITGSYDQSVKLFDVRQPTTSSCIMSLDHGAPIESLVVYPTGSLIAVGGGPNVKVYDIVTGKCVHKLENFQKTVTSVCLDGESKRLLAGSLDHHVKVYELANYSMVHSVKYPSPVLSVAISPNNTTLVVGMVSGALSIRKRIGITQMTNLNDIKLTASTKNTFNNNDAALPPNKKVEINKRKSNKLVDQYLRTFRYREALNVQLEDPNSDLGITIELLRELLRRNKLEIALGGRDDISLLPLIDILRRGLNYSKGREHLLFYDILEMLLDMYGDLIQNSQKLYRAFHRLNERLNTEFKLQQELIQLAGVAEMVKVKADIQ